jgi:hypothetical protein
MATLFPASLDTLSTTRGTAGQPMDTPNHVTHHTNEDDAIAALEAKVGVDGSAVTTSLDYKINHIPEMVGDSGSGGTAGLVPAPDAGDATKYLKGDGSWASPAGTGDVIAPATNTDAKVPQWDGANSKTLKDGLTVVTTLGSPGSDTSIPTEKAVRSAIVSAGGGDVTGPATNTDGKIPQWDGANSKTLKDGLEASATAGASKIVIADGSGKIDTWVSDMSDTVKGKVESATAAETTTGTDTGRAVTPDGLAGSDYGKRIVQVKVFDDATALSTGDGKLIFCVTPELNGYNLVDADAFVTTVSSSGTPIVQIRNVTDSVDMLSTRITIDANETTSYTAATAPVIDATHDDVVTGDLIAIDVDGAGTGAKGLGVTLSFQLP